LLRRRLSSFEDDPAGIPARQQRHHRSTGLGQRKNPRDQRLEPAAVPRRMERTSGAKSDVQEEKRRRRLIRRNTAAARWARHAPDQPSRKSAYLRSSACFARQRHGGVKGLFANERVGMVADVAGLRLRRAQPAACSVCGKTRATLGESKSIRVWLDCQRA
jgi:hypothetical protein